MSLKEKIQQDLSLAIKERKEIEATTLRMLNAAFLNKEKEKRIKLAKEELEEKELLEKISPVFHKNKIRTPLLITQGTDDPQVKKEETDQIVEALKKRKVDVVYLVKEGEGHGFQSQKKSI